jgi:hypothetical protein
MPWPDRLGGCEGSRKSDLTKRRACSRSSKLRAYRSLMEAAALTIRRCPLCGCDSAEPTQPSSDRNGPRATQYQQADTTWHAAPPRKRGSSPSQTGRREG